MIRKAELSDISTIMKIVKSTIKVMHEENNPQWDELYPTEEIFKNDIKVGELFVYTDEGKVQGFICISPEKESEYTMGSWRESKTALVIHRCAVATGVRGKGIASQFLELAENLAIHKKYNYVKSDTYITNKKMNDFFLKKGYTFCGEMTRPEMVYPFNCYDKIL